MAIADWLRGKASELGETAKSAAAEAAKAADMPRTEAGEIDKAAVGGWLKGKIGEFAQSVKADFAREREAHKAEIETWKVIDQRFSPLVLPRTPQGMIKSYGDVPNFQEDFSSWKSILARIIHDERARHSG